MDTLNKKSGLTCEEICRIIEASQRSNVRILKFDGLELEFGKNPEPVESYMAPVSATEIAVIQDKENKRALAQSEIEVKQQYIDDLLIQNPLELEEMLSSGHLKDDLDDGDED